MLKPLELPLPALPARSATPARSTLIWLLAAVTEALGVSVAVQWMPPSTLTRFVTAPLPTVRSAVVKPVTVSLNVKLTVEVSPIFSCESLNVIMDSVGATLSPITTRRLPLYWVVTLPTVLLAASVSEPLSISTDFTER